MLKQTEKLICSFVFSFYLFCGLQYRMAGTLFSTEPGRRILQLFNIFSSSGTAAWPPLAEVLLTAAVPVFFACLLLALLHGIQAIIIFVHSRRHPAVHELHVRRIPHHIQWLMIFTAWLPYLLLRYPAGIDWDAYHQIAQALGLEEMTSHWPPFVAWLMGFFVAAGRRIFSSVNIGVFLYALFQAALIDLILVRSLVLIRRQCTAARELLVLVLYMFSPLYAGYLTTVVKDALFSAFVLLLLTLVAQIRLEAGQTRQSFLTVQICAVSLLVCVTRNNGMFLVGYLLLHVLARLLLPRIGRSRTSSVSGVGRDTLLWRRCAAGLAVSLLLFGVYRTALSRTNIRPGSVKESLSIPFQQTARYLSLYPDEVTDIELDQINQALDTRRIADLYAPLLSDPVKDTYKESRRGLIPYFRAWFTMGLRHPEVYIDATLHNTYGFFDPLSRQLEHPYGLTCGALNANDELLFDYPDALQPLTELLRRYVAIWEDVPPACLFCNVGLQMWLAVFFVLHSLLHRKYRMLSSMTAISLLILVASPTWAYNGFRYTLPVILMNPVLYSCFQEQQNEL